MNPRPRRSRIDTAGIGASEQLIRGSLVCIDREEIRERDDSARTTASISQCVSGAAARPESE